MSSQTLCLVFTTTLSAEASWVLVLSDGSHVTRHQFVDATMTITEDDEYGAYPIPLRIN